MYRYSTIIIFFFLDAFRIEKMFNGVENSIRKRASSVFFRKNRSLPFTFFLSFRSFAVEAQMAPRSHLLVYYTTDSGEIIGDSIGFNVKLLHEKVSRTILRSVATAKIFSHFVLPLPALSPNSWRVH